MSELKIQRAGDAEIQLASDGRIAVAVPINFKRRSGRKLVTLPDGEILKPRPWDKEPTPLQRALARAHRWQRMLDSGEVRTQQELADLEGVSNPYVSRMLRLTTLAPDLVAAILDDDLPDQIKLFDFSAMDPVIWDEQRALVSSLIAEHELIGCSENARQQGVCRSLADRKFQFGETNGEFIHQLLLDIIFRRAARCPFNKRSHAYRLFS